MEVWIRSQDKKRLIKVYDIFIHIDNDQLICCNRKSFDEYHEDCIEIGVYDTKERALEVLDEIHQRLINLQCIEITGAGYISNQMRKNGIDCVYEMPKE